MPPWLSYINAAQSKESKYNSSGLISVLMDFFSALTASTQHIPETFKITLFTSTY